MRFQIIKTELQWGVIFTIMMLMWMGMEKMMGLHDVNIEKHMLYTNFVAIPAIAIYWLALRAKRNVDYSGEITYKEAFMSGLILTLVITVLSPLTQILSTLVISPQYFDNAIAYSVEKNIMTQESAESYFSLKSYLITTVASTPIMGVVTTAIVALFVRNSK